MPGTPLPGHDLSLSIGDLAARTGVSPSTLRIWEERHRFPVPQRRPSGHRRYDEGDVAVVAEVARLRDSGMRLDAAIATARAHAAERARLATGARPRSVYAEMLRHTPGLSVHRLRKPTLIALSHAIEDEFCSRARDAHVFGLFQRTPYFEAARNRWRELARVAGQAYAFADFDAASVDGYLSSVPLSERSPLRGEWAVVCDSFEAPVALSAWEVPGQEGVPENSRVFESLWTLEPEVVRVASRVCLQAADGAGVAAAADALAELDDRPLATLDPHSSEAFFNRAVFYLDRGPGVDQRPE